MFKSVYKSAYEIRFSLEPYHRLALFSCGVCANLADVGGIRGARMLGGLLGEWGKEVVLSRVVSGCCVGTIMEDAVRRYLAPRRPDLEALVVISCAGGIKCANLHSPGLPVIAACDSVGSLPLTPRNSPREGLAIAGTCPGCDDGHCVISYTAGICPVTECRLHRRYGPCEDAPTNGSTCAQDPRRSCVWPLIASEVKKRGRSLEPLAELERIHRQTHAERLPTLVRSTTAWPLQRLAATVMSGLPVPITRLLHAIR